LCREGIVPFPRCGRCHEQLLKCRYCADYDARTLDCVSPFRVEDFHIKDPDLYLACPHHMTTLAPTVQPAVRWKLWLPVLILVVAAAVATAIIARRWAPASATTPVLHARVAPTDNMFMDEPIVLHLQIWNPGPGSVEQVVVALDRTYEKHVRLTYVEPEPLQHRLGRKFERMWFSSLEEGEVLDVRLHTTAVAQGTWQVRLEVMAPGSGRRELVNATLEIAP